MNLHKALGMKSWPQAENLGPFVTGDNVGIEIELENIVLESKEGFPIIAAPDGWTFHRDNSLRNKGLEFVFRTPAGGKEIVRRLDGVEAFLKDQKQNPSTSNRTSVHVHVDAGNCDINQLYKWILIYAIYEPLLFAVFAPDRENSNFCVPMYASSEIREAVRLLKNASWKKFIDKIRLGEQRRYAALNLDAVRKFGTLEFRHLGGEYRAGPIIQWVNLLLQMKQWAMAGNTTIQDFFSGVSRVYADTHTYNVFGFDTGRIFTTHSAFKDLYLKGVRVAQEIHLTEELPNVPPELKERLEELIKIKFTKKIKLLAAQIDEMKEVLLNEYEKILKKKPPLGDRPRVNRPSDVAAQIAAMANVAFDIRSSDLLWNSRDMTWNPRGLIQESQPPPSPEQP
ncbi:MAG: amidoligase family protein, partial [Nitrososphaera sp.]